MILKVVISYSASHFKMMYQLLDLFIFIKLATLLKTKTHTLSMGFYVNKRAKH